MYILTRRWLYVIAVACILLGVYYTVYAIRSIPRGGSLTGYVTGYVGAGLLVTLVLLPIRKRQYQRPMGSLDTWMRSHVALGILTAVIVGMHAGFVVVGTISIALTAAFVLTVISGVVGIILYEKVPRVVARMGSDTFRQDALITQIEQVKEALGVLKSGQSGLFCEKVDQAILLERLPDRLIPVRWLLRRKHGKAVRLDISDLPPEDQLLFQTAQTLLSRYRQLGRQLSYQRLLRRWLWAHIPLSAALMTFLLVHIISELYY